MAFNLPIRYLEKCSHVIVATSGSVNEGRDWMAICPIRVDAKAGAYDIDPAIVVFDSASLEPGPSGLVGYHQSYAGRTEPISGAYDWHDFSGTVEELRTQVTTGVAPLGEAPSRVLNSLHHMADIIRRDPNWAPPP